MIRTITGATSHNNNVNSVSQHHCSSVYFNLQYSEQNGWSQTDTTPLTHHSQTTSSSHVFLHRQHCASHRKTHTNYYITVSWVHIRVTLRNVFKLVKSSSQMSENQAADCYQLSSCVSPQAHHLLHKGDTTNDNDNCENCTDDL